MSRELQSGHNFRNGVLWEVARKGSFPGRPAPR